MKNRAHRPISPTPRSSAGLSQLGRRVAAPASPDEAKLETFPNPYPGRPYSITFDCPEFTSMCPVTGQPDFGTITIRYIPAKRCVESKSLKLYLGSFRNQGQFAETITNRVLGDFVAACRPVFCTVRGRFAPRGGIAIDVTATHGREPRSRALS